MSFSAIGVLLECTAASHFLLDWLQFPLLIAEAASFTRIVWDSDRTRQHITLYGITPGHDCRTKIDNRALFALSG
jgi:hypothetical protein